MKKARVVALDGSGRQIIVYRAAIFCWSYSIDHHPAERRFWTRAGATRAAAKRAAAMVS